MITISEHVFGEMENDPDGFCIKIREVMQEDYGLYIWPCSIALAEYVWQQRHRFVGTTVLELGAGTALPGIVASKVGANVTLTDRSDANEVFENMMETTALNGANCKIQSLTWGEFDESLFNLEVPNIILGADVLYESKDFDDLFATVSFLLHDDPEAVFITTYQRRSGHRLIEYLVAKWNLRCTKLIDAFSFMPCHKEYSLSVSIELVELQCQM
ncbi:hypothetical protein O6H91_12G035700 [Diphasiastrum complanatum]|uniref:Uncharacterized protein n=1 Tax=Diphasiastrum complanatum TaxID=34168 RepID=A0ACC2C0A8_DIPCM|nr:hypothetical protein O6H91_12G035700 [Diphasiastrum complanatum]